MTAKKSTKKAAVKKPVKVVKKLEKPLNVKGSRRVSEDSAGNHHEQITPKAKPKKTAKAEKPRKDVASKVTNGSDKPVVTHTVADTLHAKLDANRKREGLAWAEVKNVGEKVSVFMGLHSEAVQAAKNDNKEFVVAVEQTPEKIISDAWHEVKGDGDPEFDQCVPTHREKFNSHAQAILNGASPMLGDTCLARFEQKVAELMKI